MAIRGRRNRAGIGMLLVAMLLLSSLQGVLAQTPEVTNDHFQRTWDRTDKPVEDGAVERTWMWGLPHSEEMQEEYFQSPGQQRTVQYFDKARMEITHPEGDPDSIWYVTNGLLVVEMITGQLQVNDFTEQNQYRFPAQVNVAGDANDPNGPTYASFLNHLDPVENRGDALIIDWIARSGDLVEHDPSISIPEVRYGFYDDVTGHNIAAPFWAFMNSEGTVWENDQFVTDKLFENPFYATGRPITEPYWADVVVAGTGQLVLMQCFERRCLTFTPGNEPGWQVEAGNVGQHYYAWRYAQTDATGTLLGLGSVPSVKPDRPVTNVFLFDTDGSIIVNLSGDNNEVNDQQPVWSPDGTKVAFQRGPEWDSHIFVVDADGSNLTQLTDDGFSFSPAWSPDGSTIAFTRRIADKEFQIFLMNADGSDQRQLTFIEPVDEQGSFSGGAAWSPDGTRIAFTNTVRPSPPQNRTTNLYVVNIDGSGLTQLTEDYDAASPVWSPDGTMIAFIQPGGGGRDFVGSRLFVMQSDGSDLVEIRWDRDEPGRNDHHSPDWSPDGTKLVYRQNRGLIVTNPDGTDQQVLIGPTLDPVWNWGGGVQPVWSPDGQYIAFTNHGIVIVLADGSNPVHITTSGGGSLSWRPE